MRKGVGKFALFSNEEQDVLFPVERCPSEAQDQIVCFHRNAVGLLSFTQQSVRFTVKRSVRANMFGTGAKDVQIDQQDIVGVVKKGSTVFEVWHCPLASAKDLKRKLVKSEFTIMQEGIDQYEDSPEQVAQSLVQQIQETCCWNAADQPPRVLVIADTHSGKSSKNMQQWERTVLPILQDAAGFRVELHDAMLSEQLDVAGARAVVVIDGVNTQAFFRPGQLEQAGVPLVHVPGTGGSLPGSPRSGWCPVTLAYSICKGVLDFEADDCAVTVVITLATSSGLTVPPPPQPRTPCNSSASRTSMLRNGMLGRKGVPGNSACSQQEEQQQDKPQAPCPPVKGLLGDSIASSQAAAINPAPRKPAGFLSTATAAASGLISNLDERASSLQLKGEAGFVCEMLRDLIKSNKSSKDSSSGLLTIPSAAAPQKDLILLHDQNMDPLAVSAPKPAAKKSRGPFGSGWRWGADQRSKLLDAQSIDWNECSDTVPAYRPSAGVSHQFV